MNYGKNAWFWVFLAISIYLFFSLTFLELPGLQYDEASFGSAAMGNTRFIAWDIEVFGKKLPIMMMNYIGALKIALYGPIFWISEPGATAVRLPVVCIGLITLLFGYGLFRRMFDGTIAVGGLFLFATAPSFIFANKLDWGPVSLMLALEMASMYFLWRWMWEGRRYFLVIAGFLFGLGLYNKIIFAWYLAALFAALFLVFRDHFRQLLRRRQMTCFLPAFLLGCLPLVAFNIDLPLRTFEYRQGFTSVGVETLTQRYQLLRETLDGQGLYFFINREDVEAPLEPVKGEVTSFPGFLIGRLAAPTWVRRCLTPAALALSIPVILVLWLSKRLARKREILFVEAILFLMALFMYMTAEATGAHHVVALFPFTFPLIAYAICGFARLIGGTRAMEGILICVFLLALVSTQVVVDARYLRAFQTKGGVATWSDAIYELSSFARDNPDRKFVFMEWGLATQLHLLSRGRIWYEEQLQCEPKNTGYCLDTLVSDPKALLVFYAPPFGDTLGLDAYKQALERNRSEGRLVGTFYQRDGRPVYLVYENHKL